MKQLTIENFKCFKNIKIPLTELTILAGANGNGKSSVIQALLLLRTSIEKCSKVNTKTKQYEIPGDEEIKGIGIGLNDDYNLSLGYSEYVIPRNSNSSVLEFSLSENTTDFGMKFNAVESKLYIEPISVSGKEKPLSLFNQSFYLQFYKK